MIHYFFLFQLFSLSSLGATPEEDTQRLSKLIKPIPDSVWQSIASEKFSENYEVAQGDTLYDISQRLFGDPKYWPKIWAVNNSKILNPHLIFPGNQIVFQSGTGMDPPQLGLAPSSESPGGIENAPTDSIPLTQAGRSKEWKQLPRQKWEQVQIKMPPQIDPNGIDNRSVVRFDVHSGFQIPIFVTTERLESFGLLESSTKPSDGLTKGDLVYIKSEEELKSGSEYSLVYEPQALSTQHSSEKGYGYSHLGVVKILNKKDTHFEAEILHAYAPIYRHAELVTKREKIKSPLPKPGPSPIPGNLISHKEISSSELSEHTYAIVDRGSSDGIEPGMIFRAYQYKDPKTKKSITENDVIFLADFMVVQTADSFSTVLGINSVETITNKSKVVLLTDVSQYLKKRKVNTRDLEPETVVFDPLLRIDLGDEISDKEKTEVKELEEVEEKDSFNEFEEDDTESLDDLNDLDETDEFNELDDLNETESTDLDATEELSEDLNEDFGDELDALDETAEAAPESAAPSTPSEPASSSSTPDASESISDESLEDFDLLEE